MAQKTAYRFFKRLGDILLALPLALLSTPLVLFLAILIFCRDPGNPFFLQKRVGYQGSAITVLKLRSMKRHADNLEDMLTPEELELYRTEYKLNNDPRLIGFKPDADCRACFGSVLRRTSVDELPQLWWNVLICGNMSLVGPRPILPDELQQHYTPEEQKLFLSVKPGLTGYWQAYARNTACYTDGKRQEMELFYVQNASPLLDLRILLRTVVAVLTKVGAK
jgi:lipopolysaccharide/colanic/teichoic acid biosynthesis glycosyltransferase